MISATLGLPPAAVAAFAPGFAAGFGSGLAAADSGAVESSIVAASAAVDSASAAGETPCDCVPAFWARAAAIISATDIFFLSAIGIASATSRWHVSRPASELRPKTSCKSFGKKVF
jgi:hypothetical protein